MPVVLKSALAPGGALAPLLDFGGDAGAMVACPLPTVGNWRPSGARRGGGDGGGVDNDHGSGGGGIGQGHGGDGGGNGNGNANRGDGDDDNNGGGGGHDTRDDAGDGGGGGSDGGGGRGGELDALLARVAGAGPDEADALQAAVAAWWAATKHRYALEVAVLVGGGATGGADRGPEPAAPTAPAVFA